MNLHIDDPNTVSMIWYKCTYDRDVYQVCNSILGTMFTGTEDQCDLVMAIIEEVKKEMQTP